MLRYLRLAAIGAGLLGWAGPAGAWHHHVYTTRAVVAQPAVVVQQPAIVQQPATVIQQPVYVQPAVVQQPAFVQQPASVIQQPVYVQPVYVQPQAATVQPAAVQAAQPCPQQELRIRVYTDGGTGATVTQQPVTVQPATVSKDHIAALLKAAEATKRSLDEAQKTNDAVISALKALHK